MVGLGIYQAQVARATLTPDGNGNNPKVWVIVASSVIVRVASMSSYEIQAHSTLETRMSHNVIFEGEHDVRKEDHILVTWKNGGQRVFIVQDILPSDQFGGRYTVAQCLEIMGRKE
jgi:hypothetical protein